MLLSDFDYDLPPELIAQEPLETRDASRLLVLERATGRIDHRRFTDLPVLLAPGDTLILNDTKVRPARLIGRRVSPGASGRAEVLLSERAAEEPGPRGGQIWRGLVRGARRPGDLIDFGEGLTGCLLSREREGLWTVELLADPGGDPLRDLLERCGRMPLPPYIRRSADGADPRDAADRHRYQTVYAAHPGAIAAPTAGLHFTPELIERIRSRGVSAETLTLHVGIGTFRPVRVEPIEQHRIPEEAYAIPAAAARAAARTREAGGRVVAVGTTVARALEATCSDDGRIGAGAGRCDLFIRPGHHFRAVDALVTNFHLPRSSLLMLVSAFAGRERVLAAYEDAVRSGYRFYSYGDAMFIH